MNSQGGRDNGATDVTTAGSASGGDKDSSSNENSNIAFGQSVEECMVSLFRELVNIPHLRMHGKSISGYFCHPYPYATEASKEFVPHYRSKPAVKV